MREKRGNLSSLLRNCWTFDISPRNIYALSIIQTSVQSSFFPILVLTRDGSPLPLIIFSRKTMIKVTKVGRGDGGEQVLIKNRNIIFVFQT